jgi:shikimate dehydrogenase
VNTVALRGGGEMYGVSTDGGGFIASLEARGFDFRAGGAVVLGAGGAAASVAAALSAKGARVRVAARRPELFDAPSGVERAPWSCLEDAVRGAALLVNATPLGMEGAGGEFDGFGFLSGLKRGAVVYDLVYNPRKTRLLREAEAAGHNAVNGAAMLVYQAALSCEFITGVRPPADAIADAIGFFESA